MFHADYIISLTHLCFIAFLSLYVCIDVLTCSDVQLQEYLINLLTYLLACLLTVWLVSSRVFCPTRHITGHFEDHSFRAIDYTSTANHK